MENYNSNRVLRLKELTVKRFPEEHKIDLSKDPAAMKRINTNPKKIFLSYPVTSVQRNELQFPGKSIQ